jgi:hypothetical protein
MLVPQNNYSMALNITSDGTVNGTICSFNGLTVKESYSVASDGTKYGTTLTLDGMNGTYQLGYDDMENATLLENILESELGAANVSYTLSGATSSTNPMMTVYTKSKMPVGTYVLLSVAIDESTGNIAAINQTTINLGTSTFTIPLVAGWNLISEPFVPTDNSVADLFAPIKSDIWVAWAYNETAPTGQNWEFYTPLSGYASNTFTTFSQNRGFWVLTYHAADLTVSGTLPESTDMNLNQNGWTIAGNPTLTSRDPATVYGNTWVVWAYNGSKPTGQNWEFYTPLSGYASNTITSLEPGVGYWTLYPKPS